MFEQNTEHCVRVVRRIILLFKKLVLMKLSRFTLLRSEFMRTQQIDMESDKIYASTAFELQI